jgi:hypothetical protein
VSCPLDCEYLQEARRHERPSQVDPSQIPNQDIRITDDFLRSHEDLLAFVSRTLAGRALETAGVVDLDVREALEALIRTYRTLQSGVYYETRPDNPLAGKIQSAFQAAMQQFRQTEAQNLGISRTRDADILGVLVMLQRMEIDRNNGRRRGRAFLDFLRQAFSVTPEVAPPAPSPLIVP